MWQSSPRMSVSRYQVARCLASAHSRCLLCAALVVQNSPLFLQALDGADHMLYHHIVHSALDIVGEKCARSCRVSVVVDFAHARWCLEQTNHVCRKIRTCILDFCAQSMTAACTSPVCSPAVSHLTPDPASRYGYVTNTQIKFILVTADVIVRDSDISSVWCLVQCDPAVLRWLTLRSPAAVQGHARCVRAAHEQPVRQGRQ